MRHLKEFIKLFEDAEAAGEVEVVGNSETSPSLDFSMGEVRRLDSYRSLLELGFKDVTPEKSTKGTLRFSHPVFGGMDYIIYASGYIRRQDTGSNNWRGDKSMVTQSITPPNITRYTFDYSKGVFNREAKETSKPSLLYGQPITEPHDYDIKFEWLKQLLVKRFFKSIGISPSPKDNESIKRELRKFAKTSPSALSQVKKMFPGVWDEIKSDPGFDIFSDLADLGF